MIGGSNRFSLTVFWSLFPGRTFIHTCRTFVSWDLLVSYYSVRARFPINDSRSIQGLKWPFSSKIARNGQRKTPRNTGSPRLFSCYFCSHFDMFCDIFWYFPVSDIFWYFLVIDIFWYQKDFSVFKGFSSGLENEFKILWVQGAAQTRLLCVYEFSQTKFNIMIWKTEIQISLFLFCLE
jgi:hypothetical protein